MAANATASYADWEWELRAYADVPFPFPYFKPFADDPLQGMGVPAFARSALSSSLDAGFRNQVHQGFYLGFATVLFTLLLELTSLPYVFNAIRKNPVLYLQALGANALNGMFIGPVLYAIVVRYYLLTIGRPHEELSYFSFLVDCVGVLIVQSIGYFLAHKLMHTKRWWWTHRFHHKFDTFVVPVTANAVSVAEYHIAYILPILTGAVLVRPALLPLRVAICIISVCNILIHTPWLEYASGYLPEFLVSTKFHLAHHKQVNGNYAAPTFNWDYIIRFLSTDPDDEYFAEKERNNAEKAKAGKAE